MSFIVWSDKFLVNVKEIDKQHKKLVSIINDLHSAMKEGKGMDIVSSAVENLADYAIIHFATEEKYMKQFGYPGYQEHKSEHDRFSQKALDFKNGLKDEKVGLSVEVLLFIKDWITRHILGTDKKYSAFFGEKGLK